MQYPRVLTAAGRLVPLLFGIACTAPQTADTIYLNGEVITVDDEQPTAEAVAVRDGIIIAVGSEADILALRGEATEVSDLGGNTLVPGFIDGHAHLSGFGAQAVGANLLASPDGGVDTIDDLVRELQAFAEGDEVERTGWIFGMGYDDAVIVDNVRLDAGGFAPFGRVVQGMESVVDSLYAGYGEESGGGVRGGAQSSIVAEGNAYLDAAWPLLDRLVRARVVR